MELIEIISTLLIAGGLLLVFVVTISFILSKMRDDPAPEPVPERAGTAAKTGYGKKEVQKKTGSFYTPNIPPGLNIYRIDQFGKGETKNVKKIHVKDTLTGKRPEFRSPKATLDPNPRFTIVNDEIKKFNERAVGD
jgi:hypothetical protein